MALQSSGAISFSQLQSEFGGSNGISLSEYYRSLSNYDRAVSGNNTSVPTSGTIRVGNFYSAILKRYVMVDAIGGGGGGGFGNENGGEEYRGTYAGTGGTTTVVGGEVNNSVAGGAGGQNCGGERGTAGTAGQASDYGPGGAGGARNTNAPAVPTGSYGAAGGGAGGDNGSTYDAGGCSGKGGMASVRTYFYTFVTPGTTLTVNIGGGGSKGNSTFDGAAGRGGYVNITSNGVSKLSTASSTTVVI